MDITKLLAEPFDPFDIEWRVQSAGVAKNGKLWAILVPYVTNRAIQQRLDDVCGVDGWYNKYEYPTDKAVICGISIKFNGDVWLTKWDGAEETNESAVKGGLSGSMKRAAVQWGIGRYLYKLDAVIVTPLDQQPQDMSDYLMSSTKIEGKKTRIYFKRPKLPAFALPKADEEG